MRRIAAVLTGAMTVALIGATPALAAEPPDSSYRAEAPTWADAASELGPAGSLWSPGFTAGLALRGQIDVVADQVTVEDGTATGGQTFAGATYGNGRTRIQIAEKWVQTQWAADPQVDISRAPVGRATIRLGYPGEKIALRATVYANCYTKATSGDAPPPPASLRCSRADVERYGGTLIMTARPPSTMTDPGTTSVQIDTTGLTYRQLLRIAASLVQESGGLTVAGSAQMLGMCAQMVAGSMTAQQAGAFARDNEYTLRVGTIDGVPQAVTMDYRTERFTVSTVGGVVTGCTYG